MRYFGLLALQDILLYVFPTILFLIVFGLALSFRCWKTKSSDERIAKIIYRYPDDIEDRNALFPLSLALIIAATLIWGVIYIWYIGAWEVRL